MIRIVGSSSDESRLTRYEAVTASTRPVQLLGDDFVTKIARSALQNIVDTMDQSCIWLHAEHLDLLPPIGRWTQGEVRDLEDGEAELVLQGEQLPVFRTDNSEILFPETSALPTSAAPRISVSLSYCRRNFDPETAAALELESGGLASARERQAELPPLEFWLVVPVAWGATRFLGSFLDQLGSAAGEALAARITSWARSSKKPNRTAVFAIEFQCPDGAHICGYVVAAPDELEESINAALSAAHELALVAGLQRDGKFIPGLRKAAFFYCDDSWHLAWFSDGKRVVQTKWFEENPPDIEGILGHEPFWKDD